MPVWRNRIARVASNHKVGGSSPPTGNNIFLMNHFYTHSNNKYTITRNPFNFSIWFFYFNTSNIFSIVSYGCKSCCFTKIMVILIIHFDTVTGRQVVEGFTSFHFFFNASFKKVFEINLIALLV